MLPDLLFPQEVPTKTDESRACHWRPKPPRGSWPSAGIHSEELF